MAGLGRPHQRLIWKYAFVVVVLVTVAVGSVGLSESWFAYEDSRREVTATEADKAASAAVSIGQFVEEILGDLDTVDVSILRRLLGLRCRRLVHRRVLRLWRAP